MGSFSLPAPPEPLLDKPAPSYPSLAELDELLELLEEHRDHARTIALHDALYGLRVAQSGASDPRALEEAMASLERMVGQEHPLRPRLQALLGLEHRAPQRSLEAILADQPGVPLRDDPLEALELHLRQRRELMHLLEQRQEELVRALQRSARRTELVAGLAVLLFILGGLGWAVAFDWLSTTDEPTVQEDQEAREEAARDPAGRKERRHR